jgi:ribonuclease VapC
LAAVLDASAVLALLRNEQGADIVAALLKESEPGGQGRPGLISAVNWTEVAQVATQRAIAGLSSTDSPIGVVDFTADHALRAAAFRDDTKALGLSLADRACLALAAVTGRTVVTADDQMTKARVGIHFRHIRPRS